MKLNTRIILLVTISLLLSATLITLLTLNQIRHTGHAVIQQVEQVNRFHLQQMRDDASRQAEAYRKELLSRKKEYLKSQVQTAMSVLQKAYQESHSYENLQEVYKDQLRNAVHIAFDVIEGIAETDDLTLAEKQERAAQLVASLRYGPENKDYFWINDMFPRMVIHPYKPELNGTDLSDFQDPNGKRLFVEFVKAVKEEGGEGFVDYYWPKYGAEKPQPKLSFVKRFAPWDWIVGSGVYLEIAEEQLKADAAEMIGSLRYGPENKDYFWINDMHPRLVMHPYNPGLIGKDMSDFETADGKRLFMAFIEAVEAVGGREEGFVEYVWPRYEGEEPLPKLSFVKRFGPWDWVIGTGVYIDDIEAVLREREAQIEAQIAASIQTVDARIDSIKERIHDRIYDVLVRIIGITLLVMLVMIIIAYLTTRRTIIRPVTRVIKGLTEISQQIAVAASQISNGSQSMADSASRQAAAVEESSASLEEMAAMSQETSAMTRGAETLMVENIEKSGRSLKSLMELTQNMTRIESESDQIGGIIEAIEAIAFQTHLLALNAAIEAARAGNAGAGFSVVAEEVKKLAQETTEAASNTQELLESTLDRVSLAAASIKEVSRDFTDIIESATVMGEKTTAITEASKEQAKGIEQITQAEFEIDKSTQQVAANAQESAAAAAEMSDQARRMERFVWDLSAMISRKGDILREQEAISSEEYGGSDGDGLNEADAPDSSYGFPKDLTHSHRKLLR